MPANPDSVRSSLSVFPDPAILGLLFDARLPTGSYEVTAPKPHGQDGHDSEGLSTTQYWIFHEASRILYYRNQYIFEE